MLLSASCEWSSVVTSCYNVDGPLSLVGAKIQRDSIIRRMQILLSAGEAEDCSRQKFLGACQSMSGDDQGPK